MNSPSYTKRASVATASFVALYIAANAARIPAWGVDSSWYVSPQTQLLAVVLALLVILPTTRSHLLAVGRLAARGIDPWGSPGRSVLFALLLGCAGIAAFVAFPSATHLLGDGALYIRELETHVWESTQRMDRAPLAFRILRAVYGWTDSGEATFRTASSFSGFVFLLLAVAGARTVSNVSTHRWAVLAFLTTQGYVLLFFGYAENYGLVLAAAMAFLLLGLRVVQRGLSVWIPAIALGLVIPLHFSLAAFLPSLIVLAGSHRPSRDAGDERPRSRRLLRIAGAPLLTLVIAIGFLAALGFGFSTFLAQSSSSQMLPILPAESYHVGTWLLAPGHIWDVLNQLVLTAPGALLVLVLTTGAWKRATSPTISYLLTAAAFPLLFTFLANPQIGPFRDWDVFAFAALPLTLLAIVMLTRIVANAHQLSHIVIIICGAAAIHTAVWIGVNSQDELAEKRFRSNLGSEGLSVHARAYGWDTLGSMYEQVSLPKALEAFDQATRIHPSNYRYWMNAGSVAAQMGRYDQAVGYLQIASQAEPRARENRDLFYNLGTALDKIGEREQAVEAFQKAIVIDPNVTDAYNNMANAYVGLGRLEEALKAYERARSVDGNSAKIHYNIGGVLNRLERHDQALTAYKKAIKLNPSHTKAHFNLAYSYHMVGQLHTALDTYLKARALGAEWPQLYTNVAAVLHALGREEEAATWKAKGQRAPAL